MHAPMRSAKVTMHTCTLHIAFPGSSAQANFRNGRVEEFLLDQAVSAADMRSRPIAFCVATAMACFNFSPLILSR